MAAPATSVQRRFALPAAGANTALDLAADTSEDVAQAVLANQPFPDREIQIGSITFEASTNRDVALGKGGGKVTFGGSFRANTGLAVLDSPKAVLTALNLGGGSPLKLEEALSSAEADLRYVLFLAGYRANVSGSGSHPIGAFGSVSFGAAGERERLFAVVHRIQNDTGAFTAIQNTFGSFRLPRQIDEADDLKPGTMLIAEVNGSVALNVSASLGYDFNFVRDLESIGITGDIGLKIELGLEATLGFTASGRYLVAIDRPSIEADSQQMRLRLFKLSQKGWNFGLNLSAGLIARAELPEDVDDFVKAVFGIHGQQVVKELKRIEKWTDPESDLSDLVAGLATEEGFKLLHRVTGIDPETAFEQARDRLIGALDMWDSVPERAVNAAWGLVNDVSGNENLRQNVVGALSLIASGDNQTRRAELVRIIGRPDFETSEIGKFLGGLATNGPFSLLDDTEIPGIAARVKSVLDGSVLSNTIAELQAYINEALNLARLREIVDRVDFDQVNNWLVARISTLLDEKFGFEKLDEVKDLINKVITMRQKVYEKARKALNRRYDFTLAATWQKTTTRDVLLDADFDMSDAAALKIFRSVVRDAKYDDLLTQVAPGITLHSATMSHNIERRSSVEVNMPFYNSKTVRFNEAFAEVAAEDDNGRVLAYSLDAKDKITRINRFTSQLGVSAMLSLPVASVRRHSEEPRSSWAYSYRFARKDMRAGEVEARLRPFIEEYLPDHFPERPESSLHKWIGDVDREVEIITGNGPTEFGDVLISAEIGLESDVIAPWVAQRSKANAVEAAKRVSRRLQQKLRELIPLYYFQDLDNLRENEPSSALLLWSSLRLANDIRVVNGEVINDTGSDDAYWNWPRTEEREAMVKDQDTLLNLSGAVAEARARLLAEGRTKQANFFKAQNLGSHISASNYRTGPLFDSLLFTESQLVGGARSALLDICGFWANSTTLPSRSIKRLAEFGAEITKTFNSSLSTTYGNKFLRPLGSMLFLEAARALDPVLDHASPNALLALTVLKENVDYQVTDFLDHVPPPEDDIAVRQRLVAAADA